MTGSTAQVDWTLSYNHDVGRGAAGGPGGLITDASGTVTRAPHHRRSGSRVIFRALAGSLKWTGPGGLIAEAPGELRPAFVGQFQRREPRPLRGR